MSIRKTTILRLTGWLKAEGLKWKLYIPKSKLWLALTLAQDVEKKKSGAETPQCSLKIICRLASGLLLCLAGFV